MSERDGLRLNEERACGGRWAAVGRQYRSVILTLGIGTVLSVALGLLVRGWEGERIQSEVNRQGTNLATHVMRNTEWSLEALYAIRDLYGMLQPIRRQQFGAFVQPMLARNPSIQALEWIARVADRDRAGVEAAARKDGFPRFQITELDPPGQMVRATSRPEYFPVAYVEPFQGNESALGFDLGSNPVRLEALERARDTGGPSVSSRIVLVQETGKQYGVLLFVPVYRSRRAPQTREERRRDLLGFSLGVFRVGRLVEASLQGVDVSGLDFCLVDTSAPESERLLYRHGRRKHGGAAPSAGAEDRWPEAAVPWRKTFDFGGRRWALELLSTSQVPTGSRIWLPWGVLGVGLLFSGTLASHLGLMIKRAQQLSQANEALEREIVERVQAQEALRQARDGLEVRVQERTAALTARTRQLEALRAITVEVTQELDLPTLLRGISQHAVELMRKGAATVFLWEEAEHTLALQAWSNFEEKDVIRVPIRLGEGLVGQVAERREGMVVNDYRKWPSARSVILERTPVTAAMAEPLLFQDRLVGVISIDNRDTGQTFTLEDQAILNLLAAQAVIAIENARLHAMAVRRREELEALLSATSAVMAGLELDPTLQRIIAEASRISGVPHVKVLLLDREAGMLRAAAVQGTAMPLGYQLHLGTDRSSTVAITGEPLFDANSADDPRNPFAARDRELGIVTYLGLPIKIRGETIGVLTLNTTSPRQYSPEELAYLTAFAAQAAIAIQHARLYGETVRREKELSALVRSTRTVMAGLDLKVTLERIVEEASRFAETPHVKVLLVDREARTFRTGAVSGLPLPPGFQLPLDASLSGSVVATGQPLFVEGPGSDPRDALADRDRNLGIKTYLGLPIKSRDEVLGILILNTTYPRRYTGSQMACLESFAAHAAIAIENARLFQQEQDRRRQVEAVRAVTEEIARELDLTTLLGLITRRAIDLIGKPMGVVYLWDESAQVLTAKAWHGFGDWIGDVQLRLGEAVAGTVAQRREGMIVNDFPASPYAHPIFVGQSGITAVLAEPLLYRDELVGVIAIGTNERNDPFTKENRETLALFAAQAAIAIVNAQLFEATERAARETRSLYEIARSLTTSLQPLEVLQLISMRTTQLLGTPHAQVVLYDEDTRALRLGAAYGSEAEIVKTQQFRLGDGVNGIVAESREPLVVNDYQAFPKRRSQMTDLVAVIGVPLLYRGRLLGVLTSHTTTPSFTFTEAHLALLTSFANQAAIAIENARLYGEIQQHAATLEARVKERTAELEEALRIKVEFLGKMSHELRTPLNFILGFSELLRQGVGGSLAPKQVTYIDRILTGGKRLLSLVNDVLDIAQLDAGKSRLHLESVILGPLVQEILGLVQIQATQKHLNVTTELDPWLPFVVADRRKLAQILHNLVGNAVKFTPEGGSIRILARLVAPTDDEGPEGGGRPPAPGGFIELIVEDRGIGIRPENLETIFEAFYQVDGSETRTQGGVGLGLPLVRKLVELHGGRVWAESPGPEQGSRFIVLLPRLEVFKAKRVLLVGNEAPIRVSMASALESAGFVVSQAATGANALTAIEAGAPDLLILDVFLPDLDGWEILRRVREAEEIRTLPVLVVTALDSMNAEQAVARGADEFLCQPVSPGVLVDTVARLLGQSAAQASTETTHVQE